MPSDAGASDALSRQLYALVGLDAKKSGNTYLSLVHGGIPFEKDSLNWLSLSSAELTGDGHGADLAAAQNFASLLNVVPAPTGDWISNSAKSLSTAFKLWLESAQVPHLTLTAEQAAALAKAKTLVGKLRKKYRQYQTAYLTKWGEWNNAVLSRSKPKPASAPQAAMASSATRNGGVRKGAGKAKARLGRQGDVEQAGQEAGDTDVEDDDMAAHADDADVNADDADDGDDDGTDDVDDGPVSNSKQKTVIQLAQERDMALDDWKTVGSKGEYEQAVATIDTMTRSGYESVLSSMLDTYNNTFNDYRCYYTSLAPVSFFSSSGVWSKASFSSSDHSTSSDISSSSWGGGASVNYGFWSVGANASGSKSTSTQQSNDTNISIQFEYCRTPILRQWFDTTIVGTNSWWWPGATPQKPTAGGAPICDGSNSDSQMIPVVPTEVLWTRNVRVTFSNANAISTTVKDTVSGGGSVGFWIFSVSANYSRSSEHSTSRATITGNSIVLPGTQISAFLCQRMPKSPNPLPSLIPVAKPVTPATPVFKTLPGTTKLIPLPQPSHALADAGAAADAEAEASHALLDGIMDSLKRKAAEKARELKQKAIDAAKRKAGELVDAAAARAKAELAKRLNQEAQEESELAAWCDEQEALKDTWRDYSAIEKQCCVDVPMSNDELIEGARIAASHHPRNLSAAADQQAGSALEIAFFASKMWQPGKRLRVRFMDGQPAIQQKVMEKARIWERYANIHFDFGSDVLAEIRITFKQAGSWSLVGTDCLLSSYVGKPTMNYGWFTASTPDSEFERVVVHEFGHALGAVHEHQNPRANISWNVPLVRQFYRDTQHWTDQQVDVNVLSRYNQSQIRGSQFDRRSIMLYKIPRQLVTNPADAVEVNNWQLSPLDQQWVQSMYPASSRGRPNEALMADAAPDHGDLKRVLQLAQVPASQHAAAVAQQAAADGMNGSAEDGLQGYKDAYYGNETKEADEQQDDGDATVQTVR